MEDKNLEIWADVKGYEGFYQVSNCGNVRSLTRTVNRSDGILHTICGRTLVQVHNQDGYSQIHLCKDGNSKTVRVHQLVADAFVPNYMDGYEVNHKDNDRSNNRADNLEWVSHLDNVRYAIDSGNHFCTRDLHGENNPNFNNHKLHDIYAADHALAIEKLARRGGQNGRAKKVSTMVDDTEMEFGYIRECAKWLIENGKTSSTLSVVSDHIAHSAESGEPYLGFYFKFV